MAYEYQIKHPDRGQCNILFSATCNNGNYPEDEHIYVLGDLILNDANIKLGKNINNFLK